MSVYKSPVYTLKFRAGIGSLCRGIASVYRRVRYQWIDKHHKRISFTWNNGKSIEVTYQLCVQSFADFPTVLHDSGRTVTFILGKFA